MWIIESKTGETFVIPTPWNSNEEKDEAVGAIKLTMAVIGAKRYAFVTEAWVLAAVSRKEVDEFYKKHDSLEEHQDRREILMVTVEDRKETLMRNFYILRPEHGPATLSPAEDMTSDKSEGRFANLLPKDEQ